MPPTKVSLDNLDIIAEEISKLLSHPKSHDQHRWIVALAGIPASGKTTVATELCRRANEIIQKKIENKDLANSTLGNVNTTENVVAVMPMDGYHLPRSELDKMPNREEAYERRGAHWTFDVDAFSKALDLVITSTSDIKIHGWGHEIKDPSYNAITISADTRIVIVEGLYVLLEAGKWQSNVVPKTHLRIFLDCNEEITFQRGPIRNFQAGISPTLEASVDRWRSNDMENAKFIVQHLDFDKLNFLIDGNLIESWK